MSTEERDALIRRLSRQGWRIRAIARELGLSKSQTHRVLMASPLSAVVGGAGPDDEDDDEDDEDENGALFDAEEPWPREPFVYVGTKRVWCAGAKGEDGKWASVQRWVDGNGHSLGDQAVLTLYRYEQYLRYELDDHERADRLADDLARQVAEYEARERV